MGNLYKSNEVFENIIDIINQIGNAKNENGKIFDSLADRLDYHYNLTYCFPITLLGIKADGITDETELLKSILNARDNITYIFPPNATIITSEPIDIVRNGIRIIGNNCLIKQKDSSGALIRHANREFCNYHQTGWLSFFGDNNIIEKLNIDINWHNNIYSDTNGDWGYFPPRGTKHPTKLAAGFDGIAVCGNNNIVTRCKIYNSTWNGISFPNYKLDRTSNDPAVYYKNNTISYNEVYNSAQDSICFIGQDNCNVLFNKIQINRYHGVHAYLKDKNCNIKYNDFYCDDTVDNTKAFPDENLSYSEGCIMAGHSLYPDYQVENIKIEGNTIINYHSTKIVKQGIMMQLVSHGKDIYIRNNYIKNLKGNAIVTDVYNFGDIVIENNTMDGCERGVTIVVGLNDSRYDLLPTFTDEIPNSNIYINNNKFSNIINNNINFSGDSYTTKEKHEAHTTGCNVYIDKNINFGDGAAKNTSENKDSFDKTIYTMVNTSSKDDLPVKNNLTFISPATVVTGEENNNYFMTKGKEVEVNACFNTKTYRTPNRVFYVKTPLNGKLYIPVVYYLTSDTDKNLKQGLITIDSNMAYFSIGGNANSQECVVMANFRYEMA